MVAMTLDIAQITTNETCLLGSLISSESSNALLSMPLVETKCHEWSQNTVSGRKEKWLDHS